jgi:hypothetical protein
MRGASIKTSILLAVGGAALLICSASAQNSNLRSVEEYKCKDIMRETGRNREVAIAFLHGYLLAKSGQQQFDLETLGKQTDAFVEQCLDNPNQGAAATMLKVKG